MSTDLAKRREESPPLQSFFKIFAFHNDLIPLLTGAEDFSFHSFLHPSSIYHSLAGDSNEIELIGLEPFFERKGCDRAGITSFHHNSHLEMTEFMKEGGQVIFTKRVPD